jgi:hypothetical protein
VGLTKRTRVTGAEQGFYACLGGAAGLLALLVAANGQWGLALVALATGAGWGWAHRQAWRWLSPFAFTVLVGCAVAGLLRDVPVAGLVVGVAAVLAAWDLDGFAARLGRFEPRPDQAKLVKHHLQRLAVVIGLGVILGEAALTLRLTLGLGGVAALGLLAVIILLQAVRLLGGETEEQVNKDNV